MEEAGEKKYSVRLFLKAARKSSLALDNGVSRVIFDSECRRNGGRRIS
jgi:hypothetical protein